MKEKRQISDFEVHELPREKLINEGSDRLTDQELLMAILGRGVHGSNVIEIAKGLSDLLDEKGYDVSINDVLKIKGIGEAQGTKIMAAFEYVRRRIRPEGMKIQSPQDVMPLIAHHGYKKQEMFFCISLNGANEVINVRTVTVGLVNRTQVHPREVFADPITDRACAIIIAHNHPSGNLEPSPEDLEVTRRIKDAGELLGIKLLDHIIFSGAKSNFSIKSYSLSSHGQL